MSFEGSGLDQRGISEVVSGLIMMSALFGFTTFVLMHKTRRAKMRTEGLTDMLKEAEKRQSQLVDVSYAQEMPNEDKLKVYLSNYGWENATIEKVWVDGDSVNESDWTVEFAGSGVATPGTNAIPKRKFVYVKVLNLDSYKQSLGEYPFAFLTESDSVYKWMIS